MGVAPRGGAPNGVEWWFIALTALFLHGLNPETINSVVPGGWSVAVEMNFYLLLPLVMRFFGTVRLLVLFFLISLGFCALSKPVILWLFGASYPPNQKYLISDFYYMNFFGQLPVFAVGLLAYAAFRNVINMKRFVGFGVLVLIVFMLVVKLLHSSWLSGVLPNYIIVAFCFGFSALALSCYPSGIFVNRAVIFFGKISFSLYLTHYGILVAFSRFGSKAVFGKGDLSSIAHFLCVLFVASCLSYILFVTVERQGILMGKRLIERLEKKSSALPAS
jgi:peptidoglycan/LPS O-acetylase OafA/YrhL